MLPACLRQTLKRDCLPACLPASKIKIIMVAWHVSCTRPFLTFSLFSPSSWMPEAKSFPPFFRSFHPPKKLIKTRRHAVAVAASFVGNNQTTFRERERDRAISTHCPTLHVKRGKEKRKTPPPTQLSFKKLIMCSRRGWRRGWRRGNLIIKLN